MLIRESWVSIWRVPVLLRAGGVPAEMMAMVRPDGLAGAGGGAGVTGRERGELDTNTPGWRGVSTGTFITMKL